MSVQVLRSVEASPSPGHWRGYPRGSEPMASLDGGVWPGTWVDIVLGNGLGRRLVRQCRLERGIPTVITQDRDHHWPAQSHSVTLPEQTNPPAPGPVIAVFAGKTVFVPAAGLDHDCGARPSAKCPTHWVY